MCIRDSPLKLHEKVEFRESRGNIQQQRYLLEPEDVVNAIVHSLLSKSTLINSYNLTKLKDIVQIVRGVSSIATQTSNQYGDKLPYIMSSVNDGTIKDENLVCLDVALSI